MTTGKTGKRVTRRQFAQALGAGLLMAPFLKLEGTARAQQAKRARRVLLFCTMGTNPALWTPRQAPTDIFNVATDPLSAIAGDIVLVDGLQSSDPSENHGSPEALTGKGFGDNNQTSVDQALGNSVGASDTIKALLLGANTNASGGKTLFYLNGRNLPTINSPIDAFNTIFSGVGGGTKPSTQLARKRSIIDLVRGELTSLSATLGATQKAKLGLHLDSIRQLENRLTMTTSGTCMAPATPTLDGTNLLLSDVVHLDLIVSAFACGLTRVAALQFGSDQAVPVNLPNLQGEEHGQFIHGGAGSNYAQLIQLEQWYAKTFVDLVNKLKMTPEADGSGMLYDNTLIVWTRDMGDSVNHNQKSMPYVVSGGAGGYLKRAPAGRYVHYNSSTVADRHERLLLNILDAMGAPVSGFGLLTGADQTPLPDLIA
jgi:hypothetical protein